MEIFIVRTLAPLGMACNDRPVRIFSSKFRMRRSTWEGWSVPLLFVRADTRPSQQIFTDKRNLVLWYKYGKQDQSDKTDWHVLVGPATYHPSLGLITNWRWSFISRTRWFLFYKLPSNGVWFDYKHSHKSFSYFNFTIISNLLHYQTDVLRSWPPTISLSTWPPRQDYIEFSLLSGIVRSDQPSQSPVFAISSSSRVTALLQSLI